MKKIKKIHHMLIFTILMSLLFTTACSENDKNELADQQEIIEQDKQTQDVDFGIDVDFSVTSSGSYFSSGASAEKRIEIHREFATTAASIPELNTTIADSAVNFDSAQLVFISMGRRANGGFSINAESAVDFGDHIKLTILSTVSGDNCFVTQAESNPYQLLEVNSRKELIVQERYIVNDCDS